MNGLFPIPDVCYCGAYGFRMLEVNAGRFRPLGESVTYLELEVEWRCRMCQRTHTTSSITRVEGQESPP